MKISNNIEAIDLALYANNHLILADFHIGYEEALNKQGLLVPRFQFEEIIKRLESIFLRLKNKSIEKIIVNGDLKHEFGTISEQEWRLTLRLLDFLEKHCKEIILIKGNHDTILGPIAQKRNIKVLEHYLIHSQVSIIKKASLIKNSLKKLNKKIENNNILVIHGDKMPSKELLDGASTIIIGHEHPAVSIREGPRAELFKCYLVGKWKGKNLIAQPSFNLVVEGSDVLKEEILSPFLRQSLSSFDVFVVADKVYGFGKLEVLRKEFRF